MDWKKEIKLGDLVGRKRLRRRRRGRGLRVQMTSSRPSSPRPSRRPIGAEKRECAVGRARPRSSRTERLGRPRSPQPSAGEHAAEKRPSAGGGAASRCAPFGSASAHGTEATKIRPSRRLPRRREPAFARTRRRGRRRRRQRSGAAASRGPHRAGAPTRPEAGRASEGACQGRRSARAPSRFAPPARAPVRRSPPNAGGEVAASTAHRPGKKGNLVGLKIGASHIAAAQVTSNGRHELVQYAREPLPKGIVVAGEVRDPDALAVQLKEFFSKHKLPQRAVRLGVGTNRVGVRRLEISGLSDASHLENAIRFRAQEVLPIPLEEAVLDYQVVGETTDEKGKKVYRVLLVVAYRDLVQRYVVACRAAGVKLDRHRLRGLRAAALARSDRRVGRQRRRRGRRLDRSRPLDVRRRRRLDVRVRPRARLGRRRARRRGRPRRST